jgi:hypothetical protein
MLPVEFWAGVGLSNTCCNTRKATPCRFTDLTDLHVQWLFPAPEGSDLTYPSANFYRLRLTAAREGITSFHTCIHFRLRVSVVWNRHYATSVSPCSYISHLKLSLCLTNWTTRSGNVLGEGGLDGPSEAPSPEDENRSSFRNVFLYLKFRTMSKVQKPGNSEWHTPPSERSERFRFDSCVVQPVASGNTDCATAATLM